MLLNDDPPSVDTCHCTDEAGLPDAAALKLYGEPAVTVWLDGFVVTFGATWTVSVAAVAVILRGDPTVRLLPTGSVLARGAPSAELPALSVVAAPPTFGNTAGN